MSKCYKGFVWSNEKEITAVAVQDKKVDLSVIEDGFRTIRVRDSKISNVQTAGEVS